MRIVTAAIALIALAACGREIDETAGEAPTAAPETDFIEVPASDSLPGLAATPTGVAFWRHPSLAFNSMMIVAGADGVGGYNIEDGVEIWRIAGVEAGGVAVSYLGRGPAARGLVAVYDQSESVFSLYAVNNATRAFSPIAGEIPVRGNVRGFCFGRAIEASEPALHIVQRGKLTTYAITAEDTFVTARAGGAEKINDKITACAVDVDGSVLLAGGGKIERVVGNAGVAIANGAPATPAAMNVVLTTGDDETPIVGVIAALDGETGALHLFDRNDGAGLGAIRISATDELEAVTAATSMGATSANLGALYRNGAIALGVGGEAPSVRLIPAGALFNAVGVAEGDAVNPRGELADDSDGGLIIDIGYKPE